MIKSIISLFALYGISMGQRPPESIFVPIPRATTAKPSAPVGPVPPVTIPSIPAVTPSIPAVNPANPLFPAQPVPNLPQPVVPSPPAPVVTTPANPSPSVPAPIDPAPIVPVPIVPAPVTPAPVIPAPVTPAPVRTRPVVPAPAPAPVPPLFPHVPPPPPPTAPLPPAGSAFGAFGQLCQINKNAVCKSPTDIASGPKTPGFVKCELGYDCCMCQAIDCLNCISFTAGDSGAYGVKSVNIQGSTRGAQIICQGSESCAETIISGTKVGEIQVSGDMGLQGAMVTVNEVTNDFKIHCTGMASCANAAVDIIIPAPAPGQFCNPAPLRIGGINCGGPEACSGMRLRISNQSPCKKVTVNQIQCTESDSCLGANVRFEGSVQLLDCNLGTSGHSITGNGIAQCYANLQGLLCQDPLSCVGITKTVTNPKEAFKLHCGALGSCQNGNLLISLVSVDLPYPDPNTGEWFTYTEWFDGFYCSGPSSCAGATITIRNQQRGKTLELENIECTAAGACTNTQIITGPDVDVVDAKCVPIDACNGCVVKVNAADPGIPCIRFDQSLNNV